MHDWQLNQTYCSASGEIRWDDFGAPEGEPVVLVHGTPFSSYVWRGLARALAPHYRVYVWDMPGFGVSEMSARQDISLGALSAVFDELLAHWGVDEPRVVAHDIGGAVALGAHLEHGARYRRLALVDVVALTPWGSPFYRLVDENVEVFAQLPSALHAGLVREYVRSASSPGLHPDTLEALVRPWLTTEGQAAFYRQVSGYPKNRRYTETLGERYGTIDIPVWVCWGEEDSWIPVERGRQLAERIPGAQLVTIPGAGHLVQEDRPAELAAAVVEFLRGPSSGVPGARG